MLLRKIEFMTKLHSGVGAPDQKGDRYGIRKHRPALKEGKVHRLTRGAGEPHHAHHGGEGPHRGAGTMYNH
ncbi:hypothetical protein GCM10009541_16930 [Micromonospora gifhornensis]